MAFERAESSIFFPTENPRSISRLPRYGLPCAFANPSFTWKNTAHPPRMQIGSLREPITSLRYLYDVCVSMSLYILFHQKIIPFNGNATFPLKVNEEQRCGYDGYSLYFYRFQKDRLIIGND